MQRGPWYQIRNSVITNQAEPRLGDVAEDRETVAGIWRGPRTTVSAVLGALHTGLCPPPASPRAPGRSAGSRGQASALAVDHPHPAFSETLLPPSESAGSSQSHSSLY